jgi:hypothetical protein
VGQTKGEPGLGSQSRRCLPGGMKNRVRVKVVRLTLAEKGKREEKEEKN